MHYKNKIFILIFFNLKEKNIYMYICKICVYLAKCQLEIVFENNFQKKKKKNHFKMIVRVRDYTKNSCFMFFLLIDCGRKMMMHHCDIFCCFFLWYFRCYCCCCCFPWVYRQTTSDTKKWNDIGLYVYIVEEKTKYNTSVEMDIKWWNVVRLMTMTN